MVKYDSIKSLIDLATRQKKKISEICLADQAEALGMTEEEVYAQMEKSFDVMVESTHFGLNPELRSVSGLSGGEGYKMMAYADRFEGGFAGDFVMRAMGRAMATSNCNAAMGRIVATPTAGSCGILPGALVSLYEDQNYPKHDIVMGLFTAAAFGIVVAEKASISGAEGGCQAECGSASGMAAAAITEIMGGTPKQCGEALGTAIINQLGLVCDPVAGLVEFPCIKRNSSGVMIAISSALMALAGVELIIPVDECIMAMKEVGDAMSTNFKETAKGGLAATPTGRKIREQVFGKETEE